MQTDIFKQRNAFVASYFSGQWSMTELCEHFGVSRPTGYLWVSRFDEDDPQSLIDRSHAPLHHINQTDARIVDRILETRDKYGWGAKKLLAVLQRSDAQTHWPARSTVNDILDRHGLLHKRRPRHRWSHPGVVPLSTDEPNQIWPIDFKGQFKTGNGVYCYPLTVTDHFSRSLLCCQALPSVKTAGVKPLLQKLFREAGLPEAFRSDNGAPFASNGIHGLNELNVWWMQLGINHQRIHPGSPHQNGQHERMHWDLKKETTRPPCSTMRTQQEAFDRFRHRYNEERPHEAIGGKVPSELWRPSPRQMPERIKPPEYPGNFDVRRVSMYGAIRLNMKQLFISSALKNQYIGLEEVDDGMWNIVYYHTLIGRINERDSTITGV